MIELRLEDVAVHAGDRAPVLRGDGRATSVQFCLSQFEAGAEAEALIDQLPLGFVKLARKYTAGSLSRRRCATS